MLYEMLDNVCGRINKIDINVEAPLFAAQLRKMRPSLEKEFAANGIKEKDFDNSILVVSASQLRAIKRIPAIVAEMSNILKTGGGEPAFRCVLATGLAYLVQPRDLLPDDLPGGYGFIDDGLFLYETCALSWEITGDTARSEEPRKIFQLLFMCVPDGSQQAFQTAISGVAMTLNVMRSLDPRVAELTVQALIANPLQALPPQVPVAGPPPAFGSQFSGYPGSVGPQYAWKNGNTLGVIFPGGGGVVADSTTISVY